jgi:uncharacterized protein YjbK
VKEDMETETKLEITKEDYYNLRHNNHILSSEEWINVYYDYNDLLSDYNSYFRIRLSSISPPIVTYKDTINFQDNIREAIEIEDDLEEIHVRLWKVSNLLPLKLNVGFFSCKWLSLMEKAGITSYLSRIGWIRNNRLTINTSSGSFELDRFRTKTGKVFYEVEVEKIDDAARGIVTEEVISQLTQGYKKSVSKVKRLER